MRPIMVSSKFVVAIASFGAMIVSATTLPSDSLDRGLPDVQAWLQKIHHAAQTLNYSGTFVFQQADQIHTSRITHLFDGKTEREKIEILDGKPREYIRDGEKIVSYLPEAKVLLIEKSLTQDSFPAIVPASPAVLSSNYRMRMGESGRVAGFDSQALILTPKDSLRYGYKLWAERATGLLLRAQTLDERNDVVEQVAFAQLVIGNIDPAKVLPSYADTKVWRIQHTVPDIVTTTGWRVKAVPPGFKKIREMTRIVSKAPSSAIELPVSVASRVAPREITQIVYSDGLAAISVFIEPASKGRAEGTLRQGALNVMGKRHGDFWLTIVGEVPALAIKQVADSIEFIAK